jgi:acyl-CoA dehydrogenase
VRRNLFTAEHEEFRQVVRAFFEHRAAPHLAEWEAAGRIDRAFLLEAGRLGLYGFQIPEEFGGAGLSTFRYNVVVSEAAADVNFVPVTLRVHTDIVVPYFLRYAGETQRKRWLPLLASGEAMAAIAMSEPDTGSDLAGIRSRAVRDGDHYVLNGTKTFITSGNTADLVVVVARTGTDEDRRRGLTLLVVEEGMAGFRRGRTLRKLGLPYSDTTELFFDDVEVPVENRLGEEGDAFAYLTANLSQERMSIAVGAVSMAQAALRRTVKYAKERKLFGTTLGSFQNTKFVLAEMSTELEAAQHLLDRAVSELDNGQLDQADAARVKLFCTEVQGRVVDRCLQVFGGYGYTRDFDIAGMYADARVTRIYGGTSEVMKVIVARSLGL